MDGPSNRRLFSHGDVDRYSSRGSGLKLACLGLKSESTSRLI